MNWKSILLQVCISIVIINNSLRLNAQIDTLNSDDLRVFRGQAQQIIGFFEYQQNILGDPEASLREKEIIINESYKKSFTDSLVQIEDDLDPTRKSSIFKDVQDYLKDIDFFFKKAEFTYDIISFKHGYNQKEELYFTVLTKRKLSAINLKGKKIENYQNRYFELNYDTLAQGLKIVSIYTNNPEERTNWQSWWQGLPIVWKAFFTDKYSFGDSLSSNDRSLLNKLTSIDIAGRSDIEDLTPLSSFKNLQSINASGSGILNLMPLRMLKYLRNLNISNTQIADLSPLKYSSYLKILNISNTKVQDMSLLVNLQKLENLNIANTAITNLAVLKDLPQLKILNANKIKADFSVLQDVKNLEQVYLDSSNFDNTAYLYNHPNLKNLSMNYTQIKDFKYLTSVDKLSEISFEYTQIASLAGLEKLKSLKKIYCDYSKISKTEALKLSRKRPDIVVVFESQVLRQWWKNLDINWRNYFVRTFKLPEEPKIEDLHSILKQSKISIHNNKGLKKLNPLEVFADLSELDISNANLTDISALANLTNLQSLSLVNTGIKSISPLTNLVNLKYLNLSDNPISELSPLKNCIALEELKAENDKISSLPQLTKLTNLRRVYVDNNSISNKNVQNFYAQHQSVLVVYKTAYLINWWKELPLNWRNYFSTTFDIPANAKSEELHKLIRTQEISLKNLPLKSLLPLAEFLQLKKLVISNLKLKTLVSLKNLQTLETLALQKMPITDITPIYGLQNLQNLILNSLAIHKLDWKYLAKLHYLDISKNKIRNISGIKWLKDLVYLNISNTRIFNILPLKKLDKLKELVAYNTSFPYFMLTQVLKIFPKLQITWY